MTVLKAKKVKNAWYVDVYSKNKMRAAISELLTEGSNFYEETNPKK